MQKIDIQSLPLDLLTQQLQEKGQPAFRGEQIFNWLHQKNVLSFQHMTNLPKDLRQQLEEDFHIPTFTVEKKQESQLDGTIKYLFGLEDGHFIETVLMEYDHGTSLCLSTQVGCRMGCTFCASTLQGLARNLTAGEMLQQVYTAEKLSGRRVSNIVLMGIGEPLDNMGNVLDFLEMISHPQGKNIGQRHITLSTCGLVDKIKELAQKELQITLAVSLHAAGDARRQSIMPVARQWDVDSLMEACDIYFDKTGRRITFEYALIEGVNDAPSEAEKLGHLLKGRNCHVNLIPVNPVAGRPYAQSQQAAVAAFADALEKTGQTVTVRRELGRDISAACGQLRHETQQPNPPSTC